ncbi:MAG TPA: peptidoglycan DD-metalloendopeptidase family protein [Clostridiaceae bacterium]|jgi:murein DD-endopeptidase MepM/ murein hydrolase activator NlpD|nr:peptidoglycan DD-metalloendopeptidase family protein [Clostridiaceae bacterium]HOA31408.1 peptidoglycan DD-metalloendopeptidase family protein [Clostridia bacterium]
MKKTMLTRIISIALLAAVLFTCSLNVQSATLEEIEQKIKQTENQKNDINDKLGNIADRKKHAANNANAKEAELSELEKQKQNNLSEKELIIKDIEHTYDMILNMEETIRQTQEEYDKKRALFDERVKVMYQYSDYSIFQMLLESKNILDFINRVYMMATLLRNDYALMEEVDTLKKDLEHKKSMHEIACLDKEEVLAEKEKVLQMLDEDYKNIEMQYIQSRKELESLLVEEDKLLAKSKQLEEELKKLQEESKKIKYAGGKMLWPAEKGTYISSYFGNRLHPIHKVWRMHNGIDIPAPGGSNIRAANSGTVIRATWDSGYGWYIIIDHGGGISTLYAHARELVAKAGDKVERGQVIAKVGTTGTSTGNHLHFEVRVNGTPVNPLNYVVVP